MLTQIALITAMAPLRVAQLPAVPRVLIPPLAMLLPTSEAITRPSFLQTL